MMYRRLLVVSVVLAGLTLAACRRDSPPPPAPVEEAEEAGPDLDSLRAWEDSVRAAEEAARLAAERERAMADARAILEQRVHFDFDESAIRPDSEQVLQQKLSILNSSPNVRLRLEGHTDERGSVEYNQALGSRRAQAVYEWFTQNGLQANRFETTSFGEEQPLVAQSTESAWAQNRRVEFVIISGADQINPPGL